jgi:hypothetical protein
MPPNSRSPIPRVRLAALELLVAATAAGGALALLTTGGGMPNRLLTRLPAHSWFLPGIALLVVVGGSQLAGAVALLLNRPRARALSFAAGVILIGWIAVQLVVLRSFQPALQLVMVAIGGLIVYLTRRLPPEDVA